MTFLNIKYFLAANRVKNFTKAAEEVHVTQQTLCSNIASLESELGCPLFERTSPLKLTYAGQQFLKYAERMDHLTRAMYDEFEELNQHQRGLIRIAVTSTRARAFIPDTVQLLQQQLPLVQIQVLECLSREMPRKLLDNEIDLSIGYPDYIENSIIYEDYYEEETVALIPRSFLRAQYGDQEAVFPKSIDELRDAGVFDHAPFIVNNVNMLSERIGVEYLHKHRIDPEVKINVQTIDISVDMCCRGLGVYFCPVRLYEKIVREDRKRHLHIVNLGKEYRYKISFGMLRGAYRSKIIDTFIRCAKDPKVLFSE